MEPGYARKTISSSLQKYTNAPQDRIRHSFRPTNFIFIKSSPKKPQSIYPRSSMQRSRNAMTPQPSTYEWIPDNYDHYKIHLSQDRKSREFKRRAISPFDFKAPGNIRKGKNQSAFSDEMQAYITINDPFESANDQMNRVKWIQECYRVSNFRPSLKNKVCVNPRTLKRTAKHIKKKLEEDWGENKFFIKTSGNNIEIRFDTEETGIMYYMNVLMKTDVELIPFSKDSECWGKFKHTVYTIKPKLFKM